MKEICFFVFAYLKRILAVIDTASFQISHFLHYNRIAWYSQILHKIIAGRKVGFKTGLYRLLFHITGIVEPGFSLGLLLIFNGLRRTCTDTGHTMGTGFAPDRFISG